MRTLPLPPPRSLPCGYRPRRAVVAPTWARGRRVRLAARSSQRAEPHAVGTRELLVVLSGAMRIEIADSTYDLEAGDSVAFRADQAHAYVNSGASEARAHNVIIYPRA